MRCAWLVDSYLFAKERRENNVYIFVFIKLNFSQLFVEGLTVKLLRFFRTICIVVLVTLWQ